MRQPKLTVLSFGAGQDSTALLYLYALDLNFASNYAPNDFVVVCSDTGDEHPKTLEHIEDVKSFCSYHGIAFVHLRPEMGYHYEKWPSLRGFYNRTNTVGSKAFPKTCTDKLKIQPIYKWLDEYVGKKYGLPYGRKKGLKMFRQIHGRIRVLLGIAKGEEGRIADGNKGPEWMKATIERSYPLIDLEMDRQACQDYIASTGNSVPPPSNCMLCPYMSEIELMWLIRNHPEDFQDWVRIERNKLEANKHHGENNLGVWGKKTLPMVQQEVECKFGHMTTAELDEYKMSHGHCVKSKY